MQLKVLVYIFEDCWFFFHLCFYLLLKSRILWLWFSYFDFNIFVNIDKDEELCLSQKISN